ncbi:MAG: type I-MYXAN CRISPR-associated protein Cas5/Cmx5/DevS [Pyrinomonadaceae bacterium MAG19_C2-C3]|nr:type I-MYXAN CRISPR-associated protein Cas5/Cmx5/DevS [Pyrinomonadaceae bacterium MAG19_C2-C3]
MITLHVTVPYASFRKSYARSFAETYSLPPPATVYGMLLSLVGERYRKRHEGTQLAFAYKRVPRIATTLRKLSRLKYGVPGKQSKLGNAPDFIETLCGIDFLVWVDSSQEQPDDEYKGNERTLVERVVEAIESPAKINRYGVLCLGLSDDAVDDVSLCESVEGEWLRLLPRDTGTLELPVWVDHVGAAKTRWRRYELDTTPTMIEAPPDDEQWTHIIAPA